MAACNLSKQQQMFGLHMMGNYKDWNFKINLLSEEFQHTCKSTGSMLWESARLMASVLASNQTIVSGKKVLEQGSGCGGICSMIATKTAHLVVPKDGDDKALELLHENVTTNLQESSLSKLHVKKLFWGNKEHLESVKKLSGNKGFDVIIGTDVTRNI
ncbi:S-adenosyl-L-methionine-dependent methyltransferases superfamily protein [Artemisia annua]|uniref:S-adenosyl-L-methionine-dependent methyltransferases superfamily protein n=1 Tax=Artemisia annua TaxID=35608 RepID=A0A2U1LUL3_ARTAN|nr:S-adenosyl-L-methionine-dependent methyltransferases superfamily protein [Artemisia annua]